MTARVRVVRQHPKADRPSGLPGPLPAGERMLWQGAPEWRSVARRVLHIPKLASYFGLLALVCLWRALVVNTPQMWFSLATLVLLSVVALGLLAAFAAMVARTTAYTLTDKRIVMRVGVALGMSINLPFAMVESASVRVFPDGTGDIPLLLSGETRIGWTMLWPHVRPWRTRRVEPMLRSVPDAARVAQLLARGLAESARQPVMPLPEFTTAPEHSDPVPAGAVGG